MRDEHKDALNYVSDVTQEYQDQGKQRSQPGRQHMDNNYRPDIGGTAQPKPLTPDYSRLHYDQEGDYVTVRRDRFNNELPDPSPNHETSTASEGEFGGRQHADFASQNGAYSNYGVVIEHGSGAAFNQPETVLVNNDRADRGKES
jgi:hypothetical protein